MHNISKIYAHLQAIYQKTQSNADTINGQDEKIILDHIKRLTALIKDSISIQDRKNLLEICQMIVFFQAHGVLKDKSFIIGQFASALQKATISIPYNCVRLGNEIMDQKKILQKFILPLRQTLVDFSKSKDKYKDINIRPSSLEGQEQNGKWATIDMQLLAVRWLEVTSGKKVLFIHNSTPMYLTGTYRDLDLSEDNPSPYSVCVTADKKGYLILHTRFNNKDHFYTGRHPYETPGEGNCTYWSKLQAMALHFSLDEIDVLIQSSLLPQASTLLHQTSFETSPFARFHRRIIDYDAHVPSVHCASRHQFSLNSKKMLASKEVDRNFPSNKLIILEFLCDQLAERNRVPDDNQNMELQSNSSSIFNKSLTIGLSVTVLNVGIMALGWMGIIAMSIPMIIVSLSLALGLILIAYNILQKSDPKDSTEFQQMPNWTFRK